jgi:hypothetical protein
MRTLLGLAVIVASWAALGAAAAVADPGEDHSHADDIVVPAPSLPLAPPGIRGMSLLDVSDKDGTTNSDMAFYGRRAYVGNYDGFRIIDIANPSRLRLMSDIRCRANQGDLSVFKARNGRLYLLQSIDRPVTAPDCSGVDTATVTEDEQGVTRTRARFGYEACGCSTSPTPATPGT